MLVPLFDYLNSIDFTGAGMFQYVSFRSIMAFIFSLLIATFIGRKIILKLQRMQIGDVPRDLDVEGQLSKKGTPTMGGIIILSSILIIYNSHRHNVPCQLVNTEMIEEVGIGTMNLFKNII